MGGGWVGCGMCLEGGERAGAPIGPRGTSRVDGCVGEVAVVWLW